MDANKESIERLIHVAAATSQELYASILDDVSTRDLCDSNTPILLRDVLELRMGIKFILVDLQTTLRACFSTEKAYEKRYHLKNLYAGMLEGYKLLYGFGKMRKHTIWARIGEDLLAEMPTNGMQPKVLEALRIQYNSITQQMLRIESTKTDNDDRNLTYHYDDDLLLVYRLTLKTDSEEKASLKYMDYIKVLGAMLELGNQIEAVEAFAGKLLPIGKGHFDEIALAFVQKVADTFGKHQQLPVVLSAAVDQGAKQLDSFADYKRGVITIEEYINKSLSVKSIIPEFGIMKDLLDVQMLVSFMMADMATILRSYIGAGSKVEYPLFLRRLTVSRVSSLAHLIGYQKEGSDSMWSSIMAVVPSDNQSLLNEAETIKLELKGMRKPEDCDTRAIYVHLIDNHKYNSNIPAIVKNLAEISILSEIRASQEMVSLCGRISRFLVQLMGALSESARKMRIENNKRLKLQLDKIRALTSHPNCPLVFRDSMRKQMDELERLFEIDNNAPPN